jgi:hypothetical protein
MRIIVSLKYLLCIVLLGSGVAVSQSIPRKFFDALIYNKPEIAEYVNTQELASSERLGITYTRVKNKFMLGYELPEEITNGIRSGKYKNEITELPLTDSYSQVTLSVPDAGFSKIFYFDDGFISNSTYFTSKWQKRESKYFSFSIEEPKYFNDYCIERLDDFVDMIADTLHLTISEKRILEKEKIGYIFCKDENSVEKITGFKAKGMAMLGSDEVVTSYQTHFHEVAHILINYKLKKLGLYTLPFFMEGFAVATGGRGGMAPRVVTDLGYYLQKSGILSYDSILTNTGFYNNDASMSYAVAGLYNSFLLNELGGERYLELYSKVNGDLEDLKLLKPDMFNLPSDVEYYEYMEKCAKDSLMFTDSGDTIKPILFIEGIRGIFNYAGDYIKFFVSGNYKAGFGGIVTDRSYTSRKYNEIYNLDDYNSSVKYCFVVEDDFINVYNLFNDELIYSYSRGLTLNPVSIPLLNGYHFFFLKSKLFGDDFNSSDIIIDVPGR